MTTRIALCTHFSIEHFRGGEKWAVALANRLAEEERIDVKVHSLPYAPGGDRKVSVDDVLASETAYTEAWRHDLSGIDTAYVFYHPGAKLSFPGAETYIAGIHSWLYVSPYLVERYYGIVPTAVKLLYRAIGSYDLSQYELIHSVTPAFETPHENTVTIPNFVDTTLYRPDRAPLNEMFTVLVPAAHIEEKGWDLTQQVAARLPENVRVVTTGRAATPLIEGYGFLSEEELANLYARSHIVLHPARVDTDSMVINEACASGTPVVTSPLISHVRENDAILHGRTPHEMTRLIRQLASEYRAEPDRYDTRCRLARELAADRSAATVYPKLKRILLTGDGETERSVQQSVQIQSDRGTLSETYPVED